MEQPESGSDFTQTVLPKEEKPRKRPFDWYNLLAAVVMLAVGVVLLVWPEQSGTALVYIIAGTVAIIGTVCTILYFTRKSVVSPFSFGGLSLGLSLLAVGAFLLIKPDVLRAALPAVLGCMLIFSGFGSLQTAIELARGKMRRWYIPLLFALAALGCGFVVLINPFSAANVLMGFLGVALCVEAALMLISLFFLRKVENARG